MATQPRLFISHSSKDPVLTGQVTNALAGATADHPGFDVLVDTECLKAGEEWPQQLHAMMAYAHAGLLLFTPATIARPDWIRKEAFILTWRRSFDPAFKVFYALIDGVTRQDLDKQGFGPAHLDLIQALKATDAAGIAAEIRPLCPARPGTSTPFEELTQSLALALTLQPTAMDTLATELGAPPVVPWLGNSGAQGVERIAARLLAGQFGKMTGLLALISKLKGLGIQKPNLLSVMRWVAPYWVAPEAVSRMAVAIETLVTTRVGGLATINGKRVPKYTAKMFVYRAWPFAFQYQVADVESGTHKTDAEYYTQAICRWVRKRDNEKPFDERIHYPEDDAGVLETLRERRPFLFVPIKSPDQATLTALRANFPTVTFLIWTGDDLEAVSYQETVVALDPGVNTNREGNECDQWEDSLEALGKTI